MTQPRPSSRTPSTGAGKKEKGKGKGKKGKGKNGDRKDEGKETPSRDKKEPKPVCRDYASSGHCGRSGCWFLHCTEKKREELVAAFKKANK